MGIRRCKIRPSLRAVEGNVTRSILVSRLAFGAVVEISRVLLEII